MPSTPAAPELVPPTANELRLGRKVHDLEKERDSLAVRAVLEDIPDRSQAELEAMKARYPNHSTTIPLSTSQSLPEPQQLITIPHELLPTLSLLRRHIAELTRDNEVLRYTFLPNTASSSKAKLDAPVLGSVMMASGVQGLDLDVVLSRVKELIRENEELGEMVLEAGRASSSGWQKALDGSPTTRFDFLD